MSKLRSIAIIVGVILVALPSAAKAQATPTKIKLLTQNTGWALMHGRLCWTTDFGQNWSDITPPVNAPETAIADVFFLDTSHGWALLRTSHSTVENVVFGDWGFELAQTDDAGASWSVRPVQLPDLPKWEDLGGGGTIDFLDPSHGWIDLSLVSSAAFNSGVVYSTDDSGVKWQPGWGLHRVTRTAPNGAKFSVLRHAWGAPWIFGAVRFVTLKNGWLAGGPSGGDLYATHDGGKTWDRIVLRSPLQVGQRVFSTYYAPEFSDPLHGTEIVEDPWGRWITLFTTNNGGRTWELLASQGNLSETGGNAPAVVASELLTAKISGKSRVVITSVGRDREPKKIVGSIRPNHFVGRYPRASLLSFYNRQTAWMFADRLYATIDGGETWKDIMPRLAGPGRPVPPAKKPR